MLKQPCNQVRLTNIAVVRLKTQNKRFEVACFKNKILNWRSGIENNLNDVLQTEAIFQNVSKGKLAAVKDLKKCFNTTNTLEIARHILDKGDLQVSDKERDVALDALFKDVTTLISERLFNRRTGLPLSVSMTENVLNEIGFSVVLNSPPKRQALKAINLLLEKFPEDFARMQMLLNARFCRFQTNAVKEFLTEIHAVHRGNDAVVYGQDVSTTINNEETSHCSITFFCKPQHYRNTDIFFSKTLDPPGRLLILSSTERIVDQAEVSQQLQPIPLMNVVTNKHSTSPSMIQFKKNSDSGNVPTRQTCRICRVDSFTTSMNFRSHCMSEWHNFNLKRVHKNLNPVTQEDYNSFSEDIRRGFLATDS